MSFLCNLKQQEKIILNQLRDAEDQPRKLKELSQAIRTIRHKEKLTSLLEI